MLQTTPDSHSVIYKLQVTAHKSLRPRRTYMLARYYTSGSGRFLQVDPGYDYDEMDPMSWNLYGYVRGNPIMGTDPTGMADLNIYYTVDSSVNDSNQGRPGVDYTKVASQIKEKFESAGISAEVVPKYSLKGIWTRVKSVFKGETNRNLKFTTKANADCGGEVYKEQAPNTGNVYVNKSVPEQSQSGTPGFVENTENHLANVGAHETGHTIGLDDVTDKNGKETDDGSVMGTNIKEKRGQRKVKKREFSDADKKKIQEAVK